MRFLRFLPHAAMAAAALSLGACQQQKQPDSETAGVAGPEAKPGLTVSDGVLVLPAVKGNPGVAYFALANASEAATSLAAVHVDGVGRTEMHETVGGRMASLNWAEVPAGETVRFERGGKHVMLFDLADSLAAGGTAEMTLTFSGGDKLSTPLRIEAAGGDR